jgi:hypothetical protein
VMVPQAYQMHHLHIDRHEVVVRRLVHWQRSQFISRDLKLFFRENVCA